MSCSSRLHCVVLMATAQTVVEICSGTLSCLSNSKSYLSLSLPGYLSTYFVRHKRRSVATRFQIISHSNKICNCVACQFPRVSITSNPLGPFKCNCQRAESASGVTSEDSNGTWFVDNANVYSAINGDKLNVLEVEAITESSSERVDFSSSGGILNNETVQDLQEDIAESFEDEAWELLKKSIVNYEGSPVGTIAAKDPDASNVLNYDHVFIRDFIPSGIAFLLKGEYDIVRNFLHQTLMLQGWDKTMDCHSPGEGLMPASFKAQPANSDEENSEEGEILDPDFGEAAIGRVAPVDSGLWWVILLRAYGKFSGDLSLQEDDDTQMGIKMILRLCLADGFDLFPMLLVTDGSCMIDRRMGIHGHPLEIQALFYSALRCAREMLVPEDEDADLIEDLNNRLAALLIHIRENYWLDMKKLNEIYRYKTEEYSHDAVNKFNIYPDQISAWLVEWMPDKGGYLIGNLQPAHMDFRFFSLGNLWSIVSSLASVDQSNAILDLIEFRWLDLVAEMPFKICYPALENKEWEIITGSDPKNTPWSYHNGGSWPTLLWQLTVACIKMNRPGLAKRAVKIAEMRLSHDKWPEYYDSREARLIGKQARLFQTWSIAGYLVSKLLLSKPSAAKILITEDDTEFVNALSCASSSTPRRKRGPKSKISRVPKTKIV